MFWAWLITNKLIMENDKNAIILFSNKIVENPDSKIQWNKNDNQLLPINPNTWKDIQREQELDNVRKSLQDSIKNDEQPKPKEIKKNDESTIPPKKVTFNEEITVKMSDLEKIDITPTSSESIKNTLSKKIEIVTEEKELEQLVKRQNELNDHIA